MSRSDAFAPSQMIEVDRVMIEDHGIELIQMMENAGRNLAHLARGRFCAGDLRSKRIMVLAGTEGNGGGALACARRLHNSAAKVHVVITKPDDQFTPVPAHQLRIVGRIGIPVTIADDCENLDQPDLIVDGVIGYSLKGAPRGNAAKLIRVAMTRQLAYSVLGRPVGR